MYKGGSNSGKIGLNIPEGDEALIELSDMNTSVFLQLEINYLKAPLTLSLLDLVKQLSD